MVKYGIALMSILLGAIGQVLFKKGAHILAQINLGSILGILTNKFLMGGLFCYGLSTILWINVLSKMKLSTAYPMISLGYVFTFIFSFAFLGEKIQLNQIAGLGLIIAGIIFIAK